MNSKSDIEEEQQAYHVAIIPQRQSSITLGEVKARMLLDGSIDSLSIPGNVTNLRRSVSGNQTSNRLIELRQE